MKIEMCRSFMMSAIKRAHLSTRTPYPTKYIIQVRTLNEKAYIVVSHFPTTPTALPTLTELGTPKADLHYVISQLVETGLVVCLIIPIMGTVITYRTRII